MRVMISAIAMMVSTFPASADLLNCVFRDGGQLSWQAFDTGDKGWRVMGDGFAFDGEAQIDARRSSGEITVRLPAQTIEGRCTFITEPTAPARAGNAGRRL